MTSKFDHVRQAVDTGGHHCHWPGCKTEVKPAVWGCLPHWRKLPWGLRKRIWNAYTPGQEVTKTPSADYVAVAREAQDWIARNYPQDVVAAYRAAFSDVPDVWADRVLPYATDRYRKD